MAYSYTDSTWKDLLTSYNGQTITYDAIGNPLNYRDGITLTWQNGRELASFSNNNYDITYTYDASGMRTKKSIDVLGDIKYVYEGGLLLRMDYLGTILDFSYDANGTPVAFRVSEDGEEDEYYYYGVNSRGDIVSIYNVAGAEVIQYTYDAYGKPLSTSATPAYTSIATINPLRYRGYVYDRETGFYYLQSRYYDPETCRFISADTITDGNAGITGDNLFVYCANNPIITVDSSGEFLHIIVGAAVGFVASTVSTLATGGSWQDALISGAFGMVSGALCSAFPVAAPFIDMGFAAAESVVISAKNGESINDIIVGATISAGTSLLFSTADKYIEVASEAGEKMSKSLSKTTKGNHPKVKKAASKTFLKAQKQYNEASGKALFCYSAGVYASVYEKS